MFSETPRSVDSLPPLPSQTTSRQISLQTSCRQHIEDSRVEQCANGGGFPGASDYCTLKAHH